jgi:methylamine--corrinoid protein Co-methyltransferase
MADITHAAEKLTRVEADSVVKKLVKKYEQKHKTIQKGKPFTECYDLASLKPTPEWQGMYEEACEEMEREFGLIIS